jgi:hypothetical protein
MLAGATAARPDSLSAVIEPGVSATRTSRTDETGHTTEQDVTDFSQRYVLSLDRTIYPTLRLSATGLLTKDLAWIRDASGATSHTDTTAGTLSSRLTMGTSLLGGSLGYERRQELGDAVATGGLGSAIVETYTATAGWHPLDLPTLDLRLARTDARDAARAEQDATSYDGTLALGYGGVRDLGLRYTLRFADALDRRHATETTSVVQDARATYRSSLLGGRTTAYAGVGVTSLWSDTTTSDVAGTVATQRFPVAGLSLVEDFPAVPENDSPSPNPGLVNGDVRAPAAVNLGFSVGPTDRRPRDLGVQLPDDVTRVNRIQVWVDRALPLAVTGALLWDAYQSDDGLSWKPVALDAGGCERACPVPFGPVENRFEVRIVPTAARYLKVVTRPIDRSVTTDARYAEIWVTELQLFDVVPAAQVRGATSRVGESFNASAQTRLLGSPGLSHDVSVALAHAGAGTPLTWLLVNGLSLAHKPAPNVALSARVARQDADSGSGHAGALQWSATGAVQPLPTMSDGLTYSGQLADRAGRFRLSNSFGAYSRAEIYSGVSATGNAAYSIATDERGATSRATTASLGAALVPNRVLTLGATYGLSRIRSAGGGAPPSASTRQHADATATLIPIPALYVSAGVSRVFGDTVPTTLANVSLNLSPFPEGQLLARFTLSETLDTAAEARSRLIAPSLRWTIRSGMFLDVAYTDIRTRAPVEATRIQTAAANLTLSL